MTEHYDLHIEYEPVGKSGRIRVTIQLPGSSKFIDKLDATSFRGREKFLGRLCKDRQGVDRAAVREHLERIAAELTGAGADGDVSPDHSDDADNVSPGSEASRLVDFAKGAVLFHSPGQYDSEGFATIEVGNHWETWPINSKGFRKWLSHRLYIKDGTVPKQQALNDALQVLASKAIYDGEAHEACVRLAEHGDVIYLDLCNDDWEVVEITAQGWRVLPNTTVPVRFVRKRGLKSLPSPVRGGSLEQLRELVNLDDEDSWILFLSVLLSYLRPRGPFVVLVVIGEQGSAKSTLCRFLRDLVDPNVAPLRRPPRGDRELMIAAKNGWLLAFENLSRVSPDMSDSLCALATGGGFGARELYSDDSEALFDAQRPVMINGINQMATRGDLLDRTVTISLPIIPEDRRQTEEKLKKLFEQRRPLILGALLDVLSAALKNLPNVHLAGYPRMADFARCSVAAAPAFGWDGKRFQAAHLKNRIEGDMEAIQSEPIGPLVVELLEETESWTGTAAALLDELRGRADDALTRAKTWPKNAQALGWSLKRLAPSLRALGYGVDHAGRDPGRKRTRRYDLKKLGKGLSEPSALSETVMDGAMERGDRGPSTDNVGQSTREDGPRPNGSGRALGGGPDHSDHSDNVVPSVRAAHADFGDTLSKRIVETPGPAVLEAKEQRAPIQESDGDLKREEPKHSNGLFSSPGPKAGDPESSEAVADHGRGGPT